MRTPDRIAGRAWALQPVRRSEITIQRRPRLRASGDFSSLCSFPTARSDGYPSRLPAAVRAHRAGGFQAIYSTSCPITAHLVAGIVKRLTAHHGLPSSVIHGSATPLPDHSHGCIVGCRPDLERWIVHEADRLVFLSPSTMRRLSQPLPASRGHGHDHERPRSKRGRAPTHSKRSRSGRFRIVWAGALYRPDELQILLEALAALVAERPAVASQLEVHFYGHVSDDCRYVADRFSSDGPVAVMLRFHGFVPRRVALQALADADAALVMLALGLAWSSSSRASFSIALG